MSPKTDNLKGVGNTLEARVAALEKQLAGSNSAQIGKIVPVSYSTPNQSGNFSPTVATQTQTLTIPSLATAVSYVAFMGAVGQNNTSGGDWIWTKISVSGPGSYTQSDQIQWSAPAGAFVSPVVPIADTFTFARGGGTITITNQVWTDDETWTNPNVIFGRGLFLFQY
jgi:hypothetical protein